MKRYLISLPLLLLAGLGLTSCLEDINKTEYDYADNMSYGIWKSVEATDGYDYIVTFTKSAAGEDLLSIVREGVAGSRFEGEVRNVFVSTDVQYMDSVGVAASSSDASYFGDGRRGGEEAVPAKAYLVETADHDHILQLITEDGTSRFTVRVEESKNNYPKPAGYFEGYNADSTLTFYAWFDDEEPVAIVGKTAKAGGSEDSETITVEFDPTSGTGTFTTESGYVVNFAYNDINQIVVTVEGESFVVDPAWSDSEPEGYAPKYTATFTSTLFGYSDPNVILYEGDKGIGNYAFGPFIDADGFYFNVADDNTISFDPQITGYEHVQDGVKYGMVYAFDAFNDSQNQKSDVSSFYDPEARTYHFYCDYYIPGAGGFGLFEETLKITGYADEATRAKIRLKNHRKGKTIRKPVVAPFDPSRFNF